MWTLEKAIPVIKEVEIAVSQVGAHVALTGGCIYKSGERKDLDLLFYPDGMVVNISCNDVLNKLEEIGFKDFGFLKRVIKSKYNDESVDLFFPEYVDQYEAAAYENGKIRVHTKEDLNEIKF